MSANKFRGLVRNTVARSSRHFLSTHGNHRCVTQRVEIRLSGAQRFLDRKVMQSEALLHCVQQRLIRLRNPIQTKRPSEVSASRAIEINVRDPASALVGRTVDHHALLCVGLGWWPSGYFVHLEIVRPRGASVSSREDLDMTPARSLLGPIYGFDKSCVPTRRPAPMCI